MEGREQMHDAVHGRIGKAITLVLILLAGFLFVKMIGEVKSFKFIGGGVPVSNTITVSGEGEVSAPADIANFSFSVIEEAKTVKDAQDTASKKMNIALALLRENGVEDKDIKTSGYNIYPQYDWVQESCPLGFNCHGGKQELRGYEVNQTVSVRVRDIDEAGQILAEIGNVGVSNISGLNFIIDNEDSLEREARKEAITDAQEKAKQLAKDLGVTLVRVVSFSEGSGGNYYPEMYKVTMAFDESANFGGSVPEIPVGENTIISNVSISYEIR